MIKMKPTIIAAFIAGMSIGGLSYAADKATGKSLEEAGIENPKAAAESGPKGGYESVRKEHVNAAATPEKGAAGPSGTAAAGTRDWAAVDKNNDNLIQPDEMETWLKQVGPQAAAAKSDTSAAADKPKAEPAAAADKPKAEPSTAESPASKDSGAAGPTGAGGAAADKDMDKSKGESAEGGKTEGKPTTQSGDSPK